MRLFVDVDAPEYADLSSPNFPAFPGISRDRKMSSSRRNVADRLTECPGPCNPRNKVCRRTCVQSVISILEELPPCIRARLCQEDLLAVFAKDHAAEDAACTTEDLPVKMIEEEGSIAPRTPKKEARTEVGKPWRDEREEGTTQTVDEKEIQTTEAVVPNATSRFRSVSTGTRAIFQRTERASILVRNIATRGIRIFRSTRVPSCSCCLINTVVYVGLLLFLTIFARHSPTYQIFLSSQICGILAILGWRLSGTIPL